MEDTKTQVSEHKEPLFHWTPELVAECSREVAHQYKDAEMWTGDLTAEKNIVYAFMKRKKFEKIYDGVIQSEAGETLIVNKDKFEELIKFLSSYPCERCHVVF